MQPLCRFECFIQLQCYILDEQVIAHDLHQSPSTSAAAARRAATLLRSGLKTSKMKSYAACPHDVLLVIAEIGMVMLAIWGPWALIACCYVAKRGKPSWVAMVLADPNPVTVADQKVL